MALPNALEWTLGLRNRASGKYLTQESFGNAVNVNGKIFSFLVLAVGEVVLNFDIYSLHSLVFGFFLFCFCFCFLSVSLPRFLVSQFTFLA